jgi:general nucleoside transport system permease protein
MRAVRGLLPTLIALAGGLAISAVVIALAGASPLAAFAALFGGAFGSSDGLSEVAVKACPLALCGLGIALAFRAGMWNVGAEGQLLLGALAVAWIAPHLGGLPSIVAQIAMLVAAALAGAAWAAIAGWLKVWRGVSEVISTIMLNFVAAAVISYLVQGPLMEAGGGYPQTAAVPDALRLTRLFPPARFHTGVLVALALGFVVAFAVHRTVFGFEIRAIGLNPRASRLAGFAVRRTALLALAASGALAGLAGGIEIASMTYRLYERFSPGYGFTAIAVALLGRLDPLGVLVAAIFFGILEAGSNAMQREAGVSSVIVLVIQATIILFLVGLERARFLRPSAPLDEPAPLPSVGDRVA